MKNLTLLKKIIIVFFTFLFLSVFMFLLTFNSRISTVLSVRKISDHEDMNLYEIKIKYDYNLDRVINYGIKDEQTFSNSIINESLPFIPVDIKSPSFGCSAFSVQDLNGHWLMGRNFDFNRTTGTLAVRCSPKNGYRSVGFAALDNIGMKDPSSSLRNRISCLVSPFICVEGINEKGVSIAVLSLDSDPVRHSTGKKTITPTIAVRLVLDRAASTREAVDLLSQYDMYATSGWDYHFYISDGSGDGRVVEYDCNSAERKMVVSRMRTVCNFYAIHSDKVQPGMKNGIYGHGKIKYLAIEDSLRENGMIQSEYSAMHVLKRAANAPAEKDVDLENQWSVIYNNNLRTADIVIQQKWNDLYHFDFK